MGLLCRPAAEPDFPQGNNLYFLAISKQMLIDSRQTCHAKDIVLLRSSDGVNVVAGEALRFGQDQAAAFAFAHAQQALIPSVDHLVAAQNEAQGHRACRGASVPGSEPQHSWQGLSEAAVSPV